MSRPKGKGAIRHIDVAKHGDVDMRDMLWRNDSAPATENKAKLERLCKERERLTARLLNLRKERGVVAERQRVAKELDDTAKQIEQTRDELKKAAAFGCATAVLAWQGRAVFLITAHKLLDARAGDNTASPGGSKITPRDLLNQLRAEGFFKIGARDEQSQLRELRRFMRQCGVAGQQGRRTDLRAK